MYVLQLLNELSWSLNSKQAVAVIAFIVIAFLVAFLAEVLFRSIFKYGIHKLIVRLPFLGSLQPGSIKKVALHGIRIVSITVFQRMLVLPFPDGGTINSILVVLCSVYITILVAQLIGYFLSGGRSWMLKTGKYQNNPMVNLFLVVKIIVYSLAALYIISLLFSIDMKSIFGSLAALSAVLMLVFKDTILGFVASIQLSGNDMLRVGDWITVPKHGVDGDVIDISLTAIKIKNFDNTVSTIPPYTLISDTFQNWRAMQESGGRRIARSIYLDMRTLKVVDEEMLNRLKGFPHLSEYISLPERGHTQELFLGGAKSNVGLYREYIESYLKKSSQVHPDFTCMVRHRDISDQGLPLQLYFFTKTVNWSEYEAIVNQIFEHCLVVAPYFELGIFQKSGSRDQGAFPATYLKTSL